ncbi:MAG TPA: ABC transporter permease [Firmicutes bacterium]|nr:ABC transporter permease [Bacillota bacterium]
MAETKKVKARSLGQEAWRRFKKDRLAIVALCFLVLLVVAAFGTLVVDLVTQGEFYDQYVVEQDLLKKLDGPSLEHPLGMDEFGRDILLRIIWGIRYSLFMGMIAIIGAIIIGTVIGAVAGFYKKVDNVIMRCMDVLLAIPSILLATAIVAALGPSLPNVVIAIGLANIPQFARIVRASVLTIKGQEYIEAARAMGASDLRIIAKYIIPNSMAPLIVQGSVGVASAILSIASLSFVGLGVQPPTPEWGAMLSNARTYMRDAWHITVMPGAAIMLSILSLNIIGDGLRDALDPRLKN